MTDETNANSRRWIHASEDASLRNKKIEHAFSRGRKIFNEWFKEWMNKDKNEND